MKLYDAVKDRLSNVEGVISDNEMLLLNRRDFLYSETSPTQAFLNMYGAINVSYEMYSLIDFLHATTCKLHSGTTLKVHQLSRSMTLPSLALTMFFPSKLSDIYIYAPRGTEKLKPRDELAKEYYARFERKIVSEKNSNLVHSRENIVEVILCNASSEAEVISALQSFGNVTRGFLLIKGYGRKNAPNVSELVLEARINIHCSLAGYGFVAAI